MRLPGHRSRQRNAREYGGAKFRIVVPRISFHSIRATLAGGWVGIGIGGRADRVAGAIARRVVGVNLVAVRGQAIQLIVAVGLGDGAAEILDAIAQVIGESHRPGGGILDLPRIDGRMLT